MKDCITIQITQDHINRGSRGMADSCPIALAFREQDIDAVIDWGDAEIDFAHYTPDEETRMFIINFDCCGRSASQPIIAKFYLKEP